MDKFVTLSLTRLLLISKIPRDGRLTIKNGEVDIYPGGLINWVMRKVAGDGKDETVFFLQEFYQCLERSMREMIKQALKEDDDDTRDRITENLNALTVNIYDSLIGIRNLQNTYREFHKIVAKLEHIETYIIIPVIRKYIHSDINIPDREKMRKILNDPIIFKQPKKKPRASSQNLQTNPMDIPQRQESKEGNPFGSAPSSISSDSEIMQKIKLLQSLDKDLPKPGIQPVD